MKINVGDKILLKKVEDLEEKIRENNEINLKAYEENFAGKTLTVSAVLNRNPLVVEVEEDEDLEDFGDILVSIIKSADLDLDLPMSKKYHFSEKYIEKVLTKHPETGTNNTHSFGWALRRLKKGLKVARTGWNGKGLWLELQRPDAHSKMTLPYIYMNYPKGDKYHDGCRVPWLASQTDMLEEDWYEVE